MKILPAAILFLTGFFFSQRSFAQETTAEYQDLTDLVMMDTLIARDPAFMVRNIYAAKDAQAAVLERLLTMQDTTIAMDPAFRVYNIYSEKDSLDAIRSWSVIMRDTTIALEPAFIAKNIYAYQDSLHALYGGYASRRDSLIHAYRDSLSAIGNALMHAADMQDTTIAKDPGFMIQEVYAARDQADVSRDSLRAVLARAATMQDTTIEKDPSFLVMEVYSKRDSYEVFRDSVWTTLAIAAKMQDTTIGKDPSFIVSQVYAARDRLDAIRDSLAWPTIMRDTVIARDVSFIVQDLYTLKDSQEAIRDSITSYRDSVYTDSLNRHWAGWYKYQVQPDHPYLLNSQKVLKGIGKSSLQYNVADFYLYLNGERVKPEKTEFSFFTAGCLAFEYNDSLLLNSGLGFKVGVGVGIKIIQGRFTGSLHANKRNTEIYKESADDSVYRKSIVVDPNTQSLILQFEPSYQTGEIITGEYQASYKRFYEKMEDGQDEVRQFSVKIIFRCRVTGGLDSIKSR
jgi:hypothetical protein